MNSFIGFIIALFAMFGQSCQSFSPVTTNLVQQPSCLKAFGIHKPTSHLYSSTQDKQEENASDNMDKAQMEWLESRLSNTGSNNDGENRGEISDNDELSATQFIPKTGVSVSDEIMSMQSSENFETKLVPLQTPGIARIETSTRGSEGEEPHRYLVALREPNENDDCEDLLQYVMVDVPPFSEELATKMKRYMSTPDINVDHDDDEENIKIQNGTLSAILVTCQDSIHYDEQPAVYVTRKNDLMAWKKAFPALKIVMYRLDTPRDCKDAVTQYGQVLDGYGPWALDNSEKQEESQQFNFIETGRPLTRILWDDDTQAKVIDGGELPPDDEDEPTTNDNRQEDPYSRESIRKKEEDKLILAIYTPGHTFGSMTYIFPERNVCCSGYALPIEDTRPNTNTGGMNQAGPTLDYRGYLTTNKGGVKRQIESARHIINEYVDRFSIVLPSRGPSIFLRDYGETERSRILHDALNEFRDVGEAYERLGIL